MSIELRPETEVALAAYATRRGLTPDEIADEILRDRLHELNNSNQAAIEDTNGNDLQSAGEFAEGTLYDALKDYIGVVDSNEFVPGGAQMSQDCGRKFTEILLEKKRRGKI